MTPQSIKNQRYGANKVILCVKVGTVVRFLESTWWKERMYSHKLASDFYMCVKVYEYAHTINN